MTKKLFSILTALAVVITLAGCGDKGSTPKEPDKQVETEGKGGTVTIDINPGFEFKVDAFGNVVEVKAVNPDAEGLIDINICVGKDIQTVAKMIAEAATDKGYISKDENQDILVGVSKELEGSDISKEIGEAVTEQLAKDDVTARVNTMLVDINEELAKKAEELEVSVSKLQLMGEDAAKAAQSITELVASAAKETTDKFVEVAYNTSEAVAKELDKYKILLEQELNFEEQEEKLEEAYEAGQIKRDEYKAQLKDIEAKLKEIEKESDKLEKFLEENGFDDDDALDFLEDQVEKAFEKFVPTKEELDETQKEISQALANAEAEMARIKAEFKRGLVDKKEYKDANERLEALEDKLEDQLKYYEKFGKDNKAKYEEFAKKLEEKYQANLDYLDGKITEEDLEKLEDNIKNFFSQETLDKIKDSVDLDKYKGLEAELKAQYEKGLISKKEFLKKLDSVEDYFDELEDILDNDEGIDEEELQEFLEENTSEEAKLAVANLKKAQEDFKKGLITAQEFAKEKIKFDQVEDAFEEYGEGLEKFGKDFIQSFEEFGKGFEGLFNETSGKLEEAFKDLNESGKELAKDLAAQAKEFNEDLAELTKELLEISGEETKLNLSKLTMDKAEFEEKWADLEEAKAEVQEKIDEINAKLAALKENK